MSYAAAAARSASVSGYLDGTRDVVKRTNATDSSAAAPAGAITTTTVAADYDHQ